MNDNGQEVTKAMFPNLPTSEITTKEIFPDSANEEAFGGDILSSIGLIPWLAGAGETVPAWWSKSRDSELRRFWKNGDHLAGTVYTLRDMLKTVPFKVLPRDTTIKAHWKIAEKYEDLLLNKFASRGNPLDHGWNHNYGATIEDLLTQDNGSFIAIEGPGSPDGPVEGMPTKLIHLDSYRCQRTGHTEFPVIFQDLDGARYKIHKTRIMSITSMSSPIAEMFGVGFCAVSRAIHAAQSLMDNSRYKEEKMGSRPRRAILTALGATKNDVKAIESAMMLSGEQMDNAGFARFATIALIALRTGITLELFDFASLPDGFNATEDTQLGMSVLALAFGVDVRQLAFALGITGQTRSDAEIQHMKMQGKGPGSILRETKLEFERNLFPKIHFRATRSFLKLVFDFQDDAQDERVADIRKKRSERHEKDINDGLVSIRVAREQSVEDGDLTKEQFAQLELEDGRLEDGADVTSLVFSNDKVIQTILNIGEGTEEEFQRQTEMAQRMIMTAPNSSLKNKARSAMAALKKMQAPAEEAAEGQPMTEEAEAVEGEEGNELQTQKTQES